MTNYSTYQDDQPIEQQANWSGVFAMTLCIFALIACEFMPVSLLTPMAEDLSISKGMVGQGLAISGFFAVITSLFMSPLFAKSDRKTLLVALSLIMLLSTLTISIADSYAVYMLGRALIGLVIGGYWSLSTASAMRLVPEEKVPKALAVFNGGNGLAMIIAAPLGSYLGSVLGWRGAFMCLVPFIAIAVFWQWQALPSMPAQQQSKGPFSAFKLFKKPLVRFGMLAVALLFMGQFTLFTYVRPFLESAFQATSQQVSLVLFVIGFAGFIGTLLISKVIKLSLAFALIAAPAVMALIAFCLANQISLFNINIVLLGLWGLIATAAPVAWWSWVARALPKDAEVAGGLMVAIIQFSIALGSTFGGILFDDYGYSITFFVSAAILFFAAIASYFTIKTP